MQSEPLVTLLGPLPPCEEDGFISSIRKPYVWDFEPYTTWEREPLPFPTPHEVDEIIGINYSIFSKL